MARSRVSPRRGSSGCSGRRRLHARSLGAALARLPRESGVARGGGDAVGAGRGRSQSRPGAPPRAPHLAPQVKGRRGQAAPRVLGAASGGHSATTNPDRRLCAAGVRAGQRARPRARPLGVPAGFHGDRRPSQSPRWAAPQPGSPGKAAGGSRGRTSPQAEPHPGAETMPGCPGRGARLRQNRSPADGLLPLAAAPRSSPISGSVFGWQRFCLALRRDLSGPRRLSYFWCLHSKDGETCRNGV